MSDLQEYKPESSGQGQRFHLNDFEGPLDLLLFLVKKNEVSIYDIPIASITEQYLEYLDMAAKTSLDDLTEFYSLASTLLYIKSRMLLPVEVDLGDEIEDPRRDLIEKLIEYQKYKKLSDLMEAKELEVEWTIERKKIQHALPFADEDEMWAQIDVWDLLISFSGLISSVSSERIIDLYEEVSINEKLTLINELLETRESFDFTDLVTKRKSTLDVICAFLAILEAVKFRVISIYQHKLFGDIQIRHYGKRNEQRTDETGAPDGSEAGA